MLYTFDISNIISVRLNNLSLKNHSFTPLSCEDIGIRKFKIVTKAQFLLDQKQRTAIENDKI